MVTMYKCEKCGTLFNDFDEADIHENYYHSKLADRWNARTITLVNDTLADRIECSDDVILWRQVYKENEVHPSEIALLAYQLARSDNLNEAGPMYKLTYTLKKAEVLEK